MDARHCAGSEMAELMAYGASVGSAGQAGAIGFIGCAADATAHFLAGNAVLVPLRTCVDWLCRFDSPGGRNVSSNSSRCTMTVLVDYFGQEITDALAVARRFPELAAEVALRFVWTHMAAVLSGVGYAVSYAVLERSVPQAIRGYRNDSELKSLMGTGVSAAAVWHMREKLDENGFDKVRIVASSGFGPDKCRVFAFANAPVDVIGTGSFLPQVWSETYATADVISYGGRSMVKAGREFLIRK